jgi:two-component system, cell cycle sensor histidine kinase and response regulator CckA
MSVVAKPRSVPSPVATRSETILVVDDDKSVCHLTRRMLQQQGYTVLSAVDGQTALALAGQHVGRIDLLVTDVAMPYLSGPWLAQQIRATRPTIRILFMSGLVSSHNFEGVLGGEFLPKPFTLEGLVEKVQIIIESV